MTLPTIAFIGGGHMTCALVAGLHRRQNTRIIVADRNAAKRAHLSQTYGVTTTENITLLPPAHPAPDAIVLAVRPPQALPTAATLPPSAAPLISLAAGISTTALATATQHPPPQIIRAMPNTPSQTGDGMTWAYAAENTPENALALCEHLFTAVGKLEWLPEESLINAAIATSGSAPAYIYHIIEAMQEEAEQMGLNPGSAQTAILQTLRGAAAMIEANPAQTASDLCNAVAVKGGTTAKAIAVLKKENLQKTIKSAMRACTQRAKEIETTHQ